MTQSCPRATLHALQAQAAGGKLQATPCHGSLVSYAALAKHAYRCAAGAKQGSTVLKSIYFLAFSGDAVLRLGFRHASTSCSLCRWCITHAPQPFDMLDNRGSLALKNMIGQRRTCH